MGKTLLTGIKNKYLRPLIMKNHAIRVHNSKKIIILHPKYYMCIIKNNFEENYSTYFITIKDGNLLNNMNKTKVEYSEYKTKNDFISKKIFNYLL